VAVSDTTPPGEAPEPTSDPTQPGWATPTPTPTSAEPATPPPASPAPDAAAAAGGGWGLPPLAPSTPDAGTWATAPAPAKRKLTWLWILLGTLGLIAVLVVVAVVLFVRSLTGPIDATNKALHEIKAKHYAVAYARSCAADRRKFSESEYEQIFADTVSERGAIKSYDVNYSNVHGSTATVRYDIDFTRSGSLRFEATARKESGKWKPCLLTK
jgi:hypothetical protein